MPRLHIEPKPGSCSISEERKRAAAGCRTPGGRGPRRRRRASRPVWVAGCVEEVPALLLLLLEGARSRYAREDERQTPANVADRRLPLFRLHHAARRQTPPFRHFVVSPRACSIAWTPRSQRPPRFGVCAAVTVPTPAATAPWPSSSWRDLVPIQPRLDFCFYMLHVDPKWLNRRWLRSHWSSLCRRRFWDLGAVDRRRAARRTIAALRRRRRQVSGDAPPLAPPVRRAIPARAVASSRAAPLLRREWKEEDDGEKEKNERGRDYDMWTPLH
uniref:Uncharacterized protein n=1 Tax=Oryza nivara TaxID=4536 RepID=A0A0E0FJV8_ORYNI